MSEQFNGSIEGIIEESLASLVDDYATQGLQTGIRATVACLYQAGFLSEEALAYAVHLGASEVDPLIVARLGADMGGSAEFGETLTRAYEAHPEVAERAISDLCGAAGRVQEWAEEQRAGSDAGGGTAGGADAGAAPAGDQA